MVNSDSKPDSESNSAENLILFYRADNFNHICNDDGDKKNKIIVWVKEHGYLQGFDELCVSHNNFVLFIFDSCLDKNQDHFH